MTTILVLSLLVLVHELGHFLVAKLFGVGVEEFGIGLPPKALSLGKKGGTEYTLNWLPLGGFVRLAGEEHDPTLWEKINPLARKTMFWAKPAWQRSLVIIAGVVVNLLVGILLFGVVYTKLGIPKLGPEQVMIVEVTKNSPAELADLAVGEVIVRVGDQETKTAGEFTDYIKNHKGESVSLYVAKTDSNGRREDSERVVQVIPRLNPPEGEGALGVGVSSVPTITYEQKPWYAAPYYGAVEGSKEAVGWAREFIRIFSHPVELLKNLSGPVAVVRIGQQAAAEGWITMVRFAAIISLNLGIFNILPIPALDGGRLLLVGLERIVGRKRVARVEKYINAVGMGLLILLLIGVTVKDLWFS